MSLFAWMESPLRVLSTHSISGEWANYNEVFLMWLRLGHYWPWLTLGAVMAGGTFYAVQLARGVNPVNLNPLMAALQSRGLRGRR
jgi:hypothetical protein